MKFLFALVVLCVLIGAGYWYLKGGCKPGYEARRISVVSQDASGVISDTMQTTCVPKQSR